MKKAVIMLVGCLVVSLFSLNMVGAEPSTHELELQNIEGEFIQPGETTQKGEASQSKDKVQLDIDLKQADGTVKGLGTIVHNGTKHTLELQGDLYPVKGDSPYAGKLVLGDLKATEDYKVLQFRLDQATSDQYDANGTTLTIVLENQESGEWLRFQTKVDQKDFDAYQQGSDVRLAHKGMEESEVIEKVITLLNMHNKASDGDQTPHSIQVEQSGTADTEGEYTMDSPITTQSWTDIRVNFNELDRMFRDLKDPYTDKVNLSNYNLPESLFKGSGWKRDVDISSSPGWNYYARGADQGDYTITQITAFQHDSSFLGWSGLRNSFDTAFTYRHGMIIEYDHWTKDISVMYYGWGLSLEDLQMVQGALEDRNVYYAQTLSGQNLSQSGSNVIGYFVGLIPYGDKVYDLWNTLQHSTNESLGQRERFIGSTYEEQRNMHNDHVYRSASGNLSNWDFDREGANTNLLGEIHSGDGYINLRWSFQTTVVSNL
ncbi:hypothetical protein [Caldalkalibacillus salinus]|uniref:hypothetical protein n=1 Tax=Caldalkalibacillus salinus TaxID=2803787 RepID=UPI0019209447|nr:hypothetical protein [Caldalkalibacillus salinus]